MNIFVACGYPKVQMPSLSDGLELELVAHFLGIAVHHNVNMKPSDNIPKLAVRSNASKCMTGVSHPGRSSAK